MTATLKSVLLASLVIPAGSCLAAADENAPVFPDSLLETGRESFISNCGFCHGRDAQGGSQGLDLTRSLLVAEDEDGKQIGEVLKTGRPDKGMPPFPQITGETLKAVVAYIKVQKYIAENANGGRRQVQPEDLLTGSAQTGQRYFAEHCSSCHSAGGDLAGIGQREGLGLMMSMLYPRNAARTSATLTVTDADGQVSSGTLVYQDEFTVALQDDANVYRSFPANSVQFTIDDPLQAHIEQLARYTDNDMHDVYAYLTTLKSGNPD